MATSINGKTTNVLDTSWVTIDDIERMDKLMEECGVMLMGSKTYQSFGNELPNDKALQVVMTSQQELLRKKLKNVIFSSEKPKTILKDLEGKGYSKIIIAGGSEINSSFIKEGLIDEIWIIIKPLVIGQGRNLFSDFDGMHQYSLNSIEKLNSGSVELHYMKVGI